MKNIGYASLIFALGAGVGTLVTWLCVKEKYKRRADEEIKSVVEEFYYHKTETPKAAVDMSQTVNPAENKTKPNPATFTDYSACYKVADPETPIKDKKVEEIVKNEARTTPQIIDPEEFGENGEYDEVCLVYWADKIVSNDDTDEVIENVEETIGKNVLAKLDGGEYDKRYGDCIYVRNDPQKCYYEVSKSIREYSESVEPAEDD